MTGLLEDADGAPFGEDVQQAHRLAVAHIEGERDQLLARLQALRTIAVKVAPTIKKALAAEDIS